MHRCGVKIRVKEERCGAPAHKKHGLVWVCDFHWERFDCNNLYDWWIKDGEKSLIRAMWDTE